MDLRIFKQRCWPFEVIAALILMMFGCAAPLSQPYVLSDILLDETFDTPSTWDEYDAADQGVDLRVRGGVYRGAIRGGSYVFGLHSQFHTDVAIETTAQVLQETRSNGFGLICRADPSQDGDGYYFLIGSDGSYTIRRGAGREVEALIPWTRSSVINTGIGRNRIRAICIGSYLALYVNDHFIDSVQDTRYTNGVAGLAFVSPGDDVLIVEYEDILMWEASLGQ